MRAILFFLSLIIQCQSLVYASEPISAFTLDNGMKILVKEDHRAPVVVSMLWYQVGAADETGGNTGLSHALEHMMFKGTEKTPAGVFSETIAGLGGEDNAFTGSDYTVYYEKVDAGKLATVMELEADRMQNLLLNDQAFAREIQVIQEERRQRIEDNPQGLAFERFMATAHLTTPYHHPVIGWMHDLENMKPEDLRAWYQRYYVPNNATLVVIGDVKPEMVVELAKKYFGPIKQGISIPKKMQIEPPVLGEKNIKIHAPAQIPLLMIGYTVPSVITADKPWEPYALELISGILDAGGSSRLAKQLVRKDHIASGVSVWYNLYSRYQSQFILYGSPTATVTIPKLQTALLEQLKMLQEKPVSLAELERVKTQIIAQKTFEKDSIFSQGMELGLLETIGAGWQRSAIFAENIKKITPEQIQETAKRYFQENAMTTAELIPTR